MLLNLRNREVDSPIITAVNTEKNIYITLNINFQSKFKTNYLKWT